MKPQGILNITFGQENFMKHLPVSEFGFTLYNNEKIEQLIATTQFRIIGFDTQTDIVKNKMGNLVNREFTTVTLEK